MSRKSDNSLTMNEKFCSQFHCKKTMKWLLNYCLYDYRWGGQSNEVFTYLEADFMKPRIDEVRRFFFNYDFVKKMLTSTLEATSALRHWLRNQL